MLTFDRAATIFKLALPVGVAVSSTLVMSLIDLAMVAPLGSHATAAVGLAVFSNTLLVSLVAGIGPAVQGLVARRRGQGSTEPKCLPLNAGLLTAVLIGVPLTVVGYFVAPLFFGLVSSDANVTRIGVPFLRMLYMATLAIGMNLAFKGHWTGMERPNVYMTTVLVMSSLNLCGNYLLIYGKFGFPALGATGAAISTATSLWIGAAINMVLAWRRCRPDGFLSARPDKLLISKIFKLGIPVTMQEFFFSAGYVVFYWMVGKVGTAELAATNVQVRVSLMLSIIAMSLGNASATLVSRTVGEGDVAGAARWGWDAGKLGVISITLLALPLVIFPRFFLSILLSDPHAINVGVIPWQMDHALAGIGSLIYIFAYTLISLGDGNRVAMISFSTQWLLFLPAVWVVGPYLRYGLLQIAFVQAVYGAVATLLITSIWADGRWKKISI